MEASRLNNWLCIFKPAAAADHVCSSPWNSSKSILTAVATNAEALNPVVLFETASENNGLIKQNASEHINMCFNQIRNCVSPRYESCWQEIILSSVSSLKKQFRESRRKKMALFG